MIDHADATDRVDETDEFRILGYDAGWNDPRVVLEIGRTSYGQLVVLDEFVQTGTHVEDAIAWLKENEKPKGPIFAEHEPSDIEKLKAAGYPATKAEKSIDAGIAEVRKRLERDDNDRVGLLVSDRCENLIREFLGYKEDHVGTSKAEDHCLDSLRYAVMGLGTARGLERTQAARSRTARAARERGQRRSTRTSTAPSWKGNPRGVNRSCSLPAGCAKV